MTALSLFDQPRYRPTDPYTSAEAARVIAGQRGDLEQCIRVVVDAFGPCSHEEIVDHMRGSFPKHDGKTDGSIVSACARAHLVQGGEGHNRRGRRVVLWECGPIPAEPIEVVGDVL